MLNNDYVTPDNVRAADGAVRRRQPLLHRRRRSAAVLRRLAAARRLLLRRHRQRPDVAFGGWGRYYDRVLYNYDARRALPPAVRRPHVPLLGRRRAARRQPDDRLEPVVSEPGRPRRPDRQRRGAEPRGLPDRQRHAGRRSPISSASACASASAPVTLSASYSGVRSRNGFTFLFGNRRPGRHLLPGRFPASRTSWSRATPRRAGTTRCTSRPTSRIGGERPLAASA